MGDSRARMILGGGLQGLGTAGQRYFDDQARQREQQALWDRQDQLRQEEWSRADQQKEEDRQRSDRAAGMVMASGMTSPELTATIRSDKGRAKELGLQGIRSARRQQGDELRGGRKEAFAERNRLRDLRGTDREAFQQAGGREAVQRAATAAQKRRGGGKRGAEGSLASKATSAVQALSEASTAAELRDAVLQIQGTPQAKRPVVRKQLAAAEERIKAMEESEKLEQQRSLAKAGRSGGVGGAGGPFDPTDYARRMESLPAPSREVAQRAALGSVDKIQKEFTGMATAARNLLQVAADPEANKGPRAIASIYQFLRSMDDSVVREGEIRLMQSGFTWAEELGRRLRNFRDGVLNQEALAEILPEAGVEEIKEIARIFAESANAGYQTRLAPYKPAYEYWTGQPVQSLYDTVFSGVEAGGGGEWNEVAPGVKVRPKGSQ